MAGLIITETVIAQSATGTTWNSSITYYTTSDTSGQLSMIFYDGATTYSAGPFTLNPHAAGSFAVGSTSGMPSGFAGSAVLSSTVPIAATYVQYSSADTTGYSRPIYAGFDDTRAGEQFFLSTIRKINNATSQLGVQNVSAVSINATINFYSKYNPTVVAFSHTETIESMASYVVNVDAIPEYPGGTFDGSATVIATETGNPSNPGSVVASVVEMQDAGRNAVAYEGVKAGANTVYMAAAACRRGGEQRTTYFAIQNAGSASSQVKVSYYNTTGSLVGTMPTTDLAPGAKLTANPCDQNLLINELGSAVIESLNSQPLVAIGKYSGTDGLLTCFEGQSAGATKVVAPYVRWTNNLATQFNTALAVMNVGSASATDVVAYYYGSTGDLRGTETLASAGNPLGVYIKRNTTPSTAGALIGGLFGYSPTGGAVEIVSDQPIVVLVRLYTNPIGLSPTITLGEDYMGIAMP